MELHDSLVVANKILTLLMADQITEAINARIECYANGREHGYAITYTDKIKPIVQGIIFAQDRGSDQIVVYSGDFSFGVLNEYMYKNKKLFMPDTEELVKDYIISILLEHKLNNNL